jgi:hypothetical protein
LATRAPPATAFDAARCNLKTASLHVHKQGPLLPHFAASLANCTVQARRPSSRPWIYTMITGLAASHRALSLSCCFACLPCIALGTAEVELHWLILQLC